MKVKLWVKHLFFAADFGVLCYWLGYYVAMMMPAEGDCCCEALLDPPEWVVSAFESFYSLISLLWVAAFWVVVRLYAYIVNPNARLRMVFCFSFFVQTFLLGVYTLFLFVMAATGHFGPGFGEWLCWMSWLPVSVLVICLDRKFSFFLKD